MVRFFLMIMANLQGVTNLEPQGGFKDPDFTYLFKLKCEGCGELTEKEAAVRLSLSKRKGAPDLVRKCKFCEREGSVTMMPECCKPLTKEGVFHPLMMFDCKGYEPVDFVFGGRWKVESVAGKTYDNVNLSKGEFAEYDESGELLVRISSLHSSFNVWNL
ncbi:PREDICTED: UPF0587 protein v1g245604-like [Fragaria vesca subsp. vesca]|uniref:UPF0587 protein v1g245604-like n=1 Tax=Fragaria vesca subsp. vesca TaxID=101020 RepID=UPI0002C2F7F3|nr:PREDICTED: UPF0587 protein v1g245604-like [Fragaria vesca subsp. vesca]